MARHRLPYAGERPFGRVGAKSLVTGRHPRATCPMQSRAKLIGGREKRPRNADWPFEKVLVSALCIRKVARKTRANSGGGVTWGLRTHCIGGYILNVGRHGRLCTRNAPCARETGC
jgi:hypothetical protein